MGEALTLAHSDGARHLLDLAASISRVTRPDKGEVSARDLFRALLVAGRAERNRVSAGGWLYEWLIGRTQDKERAEDWFKSMGGAAASGSPDPGLALSENARAVLLRAVDIAKATVGRNRFDSRHMAAALALPDVAGANANVILMCRREFGADLTAYPAKLLERLDAYHERGERIGEWRGLLQLAASAKQAARTAVAGFASDRASSGGTSPGSQAVDPLGIQADVNAFARLICLEQATPPLSIGVFGAWGSGKSSFMEQLQVAIAALTERTKNARKGAEGAEHGAGPAPSRFGKEPRFVEDVVQIRFNAWHYADANLWASLTAEFFDQLRRGGYEGQRSSDYLMLVGKVADRVRSVESQVEKAQAALANAEHLAREAEAALLEARKKLAASDSALASEHLRQEFGRIREDKGNAAKLRTLGARLHLDDLGGDMDAFAAAVSEASTVAGRLSLVGRVVLAGGWPTALFTLSTVLLGTIGTGWRATDPAALAALVDHLVGGAVSPPLLGLAERVIGMAGGVIAGLGALWKASAALKPVLDGAFAYAKAVEGARKALTAEVERKDRLAKEAGDTLAAARDKSDAAKKPLENYGDGSAPAAPGTVLRYFLFEDGEIRDYDKHVGLVSRARRSFEQLDAIFAAARDGRRVQEKAMLQGGGDEGFSREEKVALAKFKNMRLDEHGLKIPDRIILYIDDLDRCTPAQVYEVLQAIHLLLAFELFVVVAGVDLQWVEQALALRSAAPQFDSVRSEDPRKAADMQRRGKAIDYLEKIFQLPFWMRQLSVNGPGGGTYRSYVEDLLKTNLEATPDDDAPGASPERADAADDGGRPNAKQRLGGTAKASPVDGAPRPPEADDDGPATIEQALATIQLTRAEVDFLSSREIGVIAAKSPRAVKRMVNVYRIVRARLEGEELAAFLGRSLVPPQWPVAIFLAAVETGQPVEVTDAFALGLNATSSGAKTLSDIGGLAEFEEFTRTCKGLDDALPRIVALRGSQDVGLDEVLTLARMVRRYSFNRYS